MACQWMEYRQVRSEPRGKSSTLRQSDWHDTLMMSMPSSAPTAGPHRRLRIGRVWIDALGFDDAVNAIAALVESGRGGSVFTPNVDHVVKAQDNDAFMRAYEGASLSFADGMPLVWLSSLLGCRLPGRVAGSDLAMPLMAIAAKRGWRVYLLGSVPEIATAAATLLREQVGVNVVGWDCPRIGSDGTDLTGGTVERAVEARPHIILVALGPPKQEILIHRTLEAVKPAVSIGVGGTLDFLVGRYKRAPRWIGRVGLEWAYRLAQEPRRLWRRYLVEGPRFAGVALSTWMAPRDSRIAVRSH